MRQLDTIIHLWIYKLNLSQLFLAATIIVCALLCTSCSKEETESSDKDTTDLIISIGTRASTITDPNKINDGEWRITSIRIYAFDGAKLDKMYYKDGITSDNLGAYSVILKNVSQYKGKKLYAIINEPRLLKDKLDNIFSINQLTDLQYNLSAYTIPCYRKGSKGAYGFPADFRLPMFGEKDGIDTTPGGTIGTTIYVDRAVARVDVVIKRVSPSNIIAFFNRGESFVEVSNINEKGYLLPTNVMNEKKDYTTAFYGLLDGFYLANNKSATLVFYVPERMCPTDEERLGFRLNIQYNKETNAATDVNVSLGFLLKEVKKGTDTKVVDKIERNNLYTINVTLDDHYPIQYSATVDEWTEVSDDIIL